MHKDPIQYLKHINEECKYITTVTCKLNSKEDLLKNETLKRALVRSLEIIGEASKKIPESIKDKNKDINWKNMAGMRDRLIHDYMGINYLIVFDVTKNIIPNLKKQIEEILAEYS